MATTGTPERDRRQLRVPKHGGGKLSIGNPGNRGGHRAPEEFLNWLGDVVHDRRCRARFEDLMLHAKNPELFLQGLKWAAERLYGKPVQPVRPAEDLPGSLALVISEDVA